MSANLYAPLPTALIDHAKHAALPWALFFEALTLSANQQRSGTHAERLALAQPVIGTLWYETDRTTAYYFTSPTWVYAFGRFEAPLASQPMDLGPVDAGFVMSVTDYGDVVVWDGSAWGFAPGVVQPGVMFDVSVTTPSLPAPVAPAWTPLDGTGTTVLTVGVTLGTLPVIKNTVANRYLKR